MAHEPARITFEDFAAHLGQIFDQVNQQNQPVLVERDGETYLLEKQQLTHRSERNHRPTSADDPLWTIIHLADDLELPEGPGDVSQNVDTYLAEAYLPKDR